MCRLAQPVAPDTQTARDAVGPEVARWLRSELLNWSSARAACDLLASQSVRHEHGIDIACHPLGVVSQGHRRTADDEHIGDDTAHGKPLAQSSEGPLQLIAPEQDIVGLDRAASRSRADT